MTHSIGRRRGVREKDIENRIRGTLVSRGWRVWKMHGSTLNAGWPDLYCVHPEHGRSAWVEVKRPGGKLGSKQFNRMRRLTGGVTVIVCDDDAQVLDLLGSWSCDTPQPERQWLPWCTRKQREALQGKDHLADALSEFEVGD